MPRFSDPYTKAQTSQFEKTKQQDSKVQNLKPPMTLKSKLSVAVFVLVSLAALTTAYINESMFMDKIATCLFIISCIGFIRLLSGDISREQHH